MILVKKAFPTLVLLSVCFNALSQTPKQDTGSSADSSVRSPQEPIQRVRFSEFTKTRLSKYYYVYNDDLYKYIGTWEGSRDSTRVSVSFKIKAFRFNSDTTDLSRFELIIGTYQQFTNGKLVAVYSGDDFVGSTSDNPDTLNIGVVIRQRKTRETLTAIFLPDNELKLAIGKPGFEQPRNDKNFELKEPIILTKQN